MARSKFDRIRARKAKAEGRVPVSATCSIAARIGAPLPRRRGRPKVEREVGPTPETVAKQIPDSLKELLRLDQITKAQMMAGENVLRAWRIRTVGLDGGTRQPGFSDHDSATSERLQRAWRKWCCRDDGQPPPDELYRRCKVTAPVIVWWLAPDLVDCGARPPRVGGDVETLKVALAWWAKAESEAAKEMAAQERAAQQGGDLSGRLW